MIRNSKGRILFILIFIIENFAAFAQPHLNFYNARSVAQSSLLNPALPSRQAFTLGFLDFSASAYVPGINAYDVFNSKDDAKQTIDKVLGSNQYNFKNIVLNSEINPLFIGFKSGRNYFSAGLQLKINTTTSFSKDLFALAIYGNADQLFGKKIDVSETSFNQLAYSAIYFGVSRDVNEKFTIGIRGKYLMGLFNAQLNDAKAYIQTDSGNNNTLKVVASADYVLKAAGIDRINEIRSPTDILGKPKLFDPVNIARQYANKPVGSGFGVDLGMNYRVSNRLSFSASIIDVGYISWNEGKLYSKNATFNYEGVISNNADSFSSAFQKIADSVEALFKPDEKNFNYTTYLGPKIYVGTQYNLANSAAIGAVLYGEFYQGKFRPGGSLSYSQRIWKILDLRVNYSVYGQQYANVGLGFAVHIGPLVVYASSDNALGYYNWDKAHFTNTRIGLNINIGGRFDRDNDGVPDKSDKCKKIPGLIKFNGCPDLDGDSVPDHEDDCISVKGTVAAKGCPDIDGDGIKDNSDSCENEKGTAKLFGCPDKDNDGVADKFDACPEDSGLVSRKGCPDDDGDGVLNKADDCPQVFGSKITRGCPDLDRDSVPDKLDECPDVPGSVRYKGCPDADGDGIINKYDSCITEAGPALTFGCPDTDNDGIADKFDDCPLEAGLPENSGCPALDPSLVILNEAEKKVLREAFSALEFETGTAKISEKSLPSLVELAELLKTKPEFKLEISGHTDNVGKEPGNKKLSQNRANAVKDYLVKTGASALSIKATGFGSKIPVDDNKTPNGRQRNRRVEFKVVK
ncbi:MAG: OmpA family protein [Bacteroidia bacterium]|nr:OmpA family protein [Bacteroidia bacterium]